MKHPEKHPLAGKTVRLNDKARDGIQGQVETGAHYRIEDYWDRVNGKSWMFSDGNIAATHYALRSISTAIPLDDEVVYGKINGAGHLVHVSELGDVIDGN